MKFLFTVAGNVTHVYPAYHPFRSEAARAEFLALYDKLAQTWPIDSESRTVATRYGDTFVRIGGPAGAQPLVLLPGQGGSSLMWEPNIETWSERYRTYALDSIYDFGRSAYAPTTASPQNAVKWLEELFCALELGDNINLVGLSLGGWLASQYALSFPQDHLGKLVLIAPAGTVLRIRLAFMIRVMLSFLPHPYFSKSLFFWLFADLANRDESGRQAVAALVSYFAVASRCYKPMPALRPTVLGDRDWRRLSVPTLYLVGENEKLYSAHKAVQHLNKVVP